MIASYTRIVSFLATSFEPIRQNLAVLRADQLSCSALQARRTPFIEVPKMSKTATYGRRDPCCAVIRLLGPPKSYETVDFYLKTKYFIVHGRAPTGLDGPFYDIMLFTYK